MANASNQTLVQAVARVDEARALARVAGSFRYPTVTVDGVHTRQRTSGNRVSQFTDEVANLREAVAASQNYLRLAKVQYRIGLVDYLTVVDAERTLLSNQLALAQSLNAQMSASIHLIKALGGGWQNQQ
jgi:outer membrane protein, multidrug efflux system